MAVWFATAAGNINSAGRWAANPDGSGGTLTWPPSIGDVLVANNKGTITINVSTDLGSTGQVRNDAFGGAAEGGFFAYSVGVTLTANIISGSVASQCVLSAQPGTLVGNITGGSGKIGLQVQNSSGTFTVSGSVTGGTGAGGYGINSDITGSGVLSITGNVAGGSGSICYGINNAFTGALNISGNITGSSSGSNNRGVHNNSTGAVTITGNTIAGTGTGNFGVRNNAGGSLTVTGYAQASSTLPAINNVAQGVVTVSETRSASNCNPAITGAFRYASATAAKDMPYTPEGQITMTVLDVAAIVPAESDVRKGLVYGDGAYTGTLQLGRNRTSMAGRF